MKANDYLRKAAELIEQRGKERDQADGERSMARCVATFNAMYGTNLTEEQGWAFMLCLKMARMQGGCFKLDDYEDMIAYSALMTEAAVGLAAQPVDPADEMPKVKVHFPPRQ